MSEAKKTTFVGYEYKEIVVSMPSIWALVVGVIGTVFVAGSVFAITHTPPIYWLCVLLVVPVPPRTVPTSQARIISAPHTKPARVLEIT